MSDSIKNVEEKDGIIIISTAGYFNNLAGEAVLDVFNEKMESGSTKFLVDMNDSKVVNSIGVSIYTNYELENLINDYNLDVIQIPFNLFDNFSVRGDLIAKAKNKGISIHSRSVFLQGLFFKSINDKSQVVKNLKKYLMKINNMAIKENIQISDLALNYVMQQDLIDNILIGVDSQSQLISNINSLFKL